MIPLLRRNPDTSGDHLPCHEASRRRNKAMTYLKNFLIAAPVALGLLAAPAAHAEWRGGGHGGGGGHAGGWGGGHGGYHGGYAGYRGGYGYRGYGVPLGGVLLGLGAAAVVGGIIASQPPVVYAPRPGYYAQPAYPGPYYAQPGYMEPAPSYAQ
jgi:hypothetical protein